MRNGCFPARFQPSVVSSTGARWTVDSAPRRSCLIVKLTRGAPTEATQPGSMGGSGATWTRRLRDALGSISRVCCWKRVLCHRGLMQLLGGGRGEPAWGYCGSSIHAARVVACGSGAVACLSAVGSMRSRLAAAPGDAFALPNASPFIKCCVRCCCFWRHGWRALQRLITKRCELKPETCLLPRSKRYAVRSRPCRRRSELRNKLWTCVCFQPGPACRLSCCQHVGAVQV